MSFFQDVGDFHEKMGLPVTGKTPMRMLAHADFRFRTNFLFEELREFCEAYAENDLAKATDALVDLVYVAIGTAHLMGVPFDQAWAEVQRANMEKRRWREGDPIKPRNLNVSLETVKPDGWKPPDIRAVLESFVFQQRSKSIRL
jgi:predicted HAD superfamily Cof-like phosphohydrolase